MPYDPNQVMGLNALSPTVAAYKQFIERQNNVNNPNIIHPELEGLIALKTRVDNAAKAQQALAQQPQSAPPTVADEYRMAAQQQAQQEMMAQMVQMHQARMAQAAPGLAGMPNPAMEQANFAGGGIVAFAGGGDVQHYDGLTGSFVPQNNLGVGSLAQNKEALYRAVVNQVQQDLASGKITQAEGEQKLQAARRATGADTTTPQLAANFSRDAGLGDFSTAMGLTSAAAPSPDSSGVASLVPPKRKVATATQPAQTADLGEEPSYITDLSSSPDYAGTLGTDSFNYMRAMGEKPDLEKMRIAARQSPTAKLYDKALSDEQQFIKEQKDKFGADKKEAQAMFWLNLGSSLLGNRDPRFTVALGKALEDSSGALYKDLRSLKASQEALQQKEIDLQFKRAQAAESNDNRIIQAYNSELNNWRTSLTNHINRQDTIAANVQKHADDVALREQQARETAAYHALIAKTSGGIDVQHYNRLLGTIDPDTKEKYTPSKAYQLVVGTKAAAKPNTIALSAARTRAQEADKMIKMYQFDPTKKAELAAATQAYMQAMADLERLGGGAESATLPTSPGGTSAAPAAGGQYPGFSAVRID